MSHSNTSSLFLFRHGVIKVSKFALAQPLTVIVFTLTCYICFSCLRFQQLLSQELLKRAIRKEDLLFDTTPSPGDSIQAILPDETLVNVTLRPSIPRIIHQTYKTEAIPENWARAKATCIGMNPDYEYKFWTDVSAREFIQAEFSWFLPTYDNYPYSIQRADAIRYFVLWHYGGIYIDLDIGCRKPLDPLLALPAFFPATWPVGVSNDLIASTKAHPVIIKLALQLMDHNMFLGSKYLTVFWSTGPMFVNKILASFFFADRMKGAVERGNIKTAFLGSADVAILSPQLYSTSVHSFFSHYRGSSWHGNDVALVSWIYKKLWWIGTFSVMTWLLIRRQRKRVCADRMYLV